MSNADGADIELNDTQLRTSSGRKMPSMTEHHAKRTMKQRRQGARKWRAARTSKGGLPEQAGDGLSE